MSLMIDLQPQHVPARSSATARVESRDSWWRRVQEATVERYSEWRFDRDIEQIHAALDRLSGRQLEMIGCRRDRLIDDVYRIVYTHSVAEWCDEPLPLPAWVPPRNRVPEGSLLTTITRARVLEPA